MRTKFPKNFVIFALKFNLIYVIDKLGKFASIATDLENFFSGGDTVKSSQTEQTTMTRSIQDDFVVYDRVSYKKKPKTMKTMFF